MHVYSVDVTKESVEGRNLTSPETATLIGQREFFLEMFRKIALV